MSYKNLLYLFLNNNKDDNLQNAEYIFIINKFKKNI